MQMEPLMDTRKMRNRPQMSADERRLNAKAGHEEHEEGHEDHEGKGLQDWPPRSLPGSSPNFRFILRVLRVIAFDFFYICVHPRSSAVENDFHRCAG